MTKAELTEWLKSAVYVDAETDEYDGNGNRYQSLIYRKDTHLYQLSKSNDGWSEKLGPKGYLRGQYEPKPVRTEKVLVERTIYVRL